MPDTGINEIQFELIHKQMAGMCEQLKLLADVTATLARNEEKMIHFNAELARVSARHETIERDVYGPDGVLVKLARNITHVGFLMLAFTFAINLAFKLIH